MAAPPDPWDPGVRLGIPEIDQEHQTLAALIDRLERVRADPELAGRVLKALAKYATYHFQSEENAFFAAGFPELDAHHALHLALWDQLNMVLLELRTGKAGYEEVVRFLKAWLVDHSSREDMRFVQFLDGLATPDPAPPPAPPVAAAATLAELPGLSAERLEGLADAAVRLHMEEVAAGIQVIGGIDAALAARLRGLAEEYDYPAIARLAREALATRSPPDGPAP